MPGPINTLYIMGADARGVVLGARQAQTALNGMVTHAQGVAQAYRKTQTGLFNSTAQWSFAIQDIATVLAMGGGVERALLSASNNIAFLASAAGGMAGAIAGVGIVLGSVFVPRLISAAMGTRDLTEELERLSRVSDQIADAGKRSADAVAFEQRIRDARTGTAQEEMANIAGLLKASRDLEEQQRADVEGQRQQMLRLQADTRAAADALDEYYRKSGVGENSFVRDDGGPGPGPSFEGIVRGFGLSIGQISILERQVEAFRAEGDQANKTFLDLTATLLTTVLQTNRLEQEFHRAALAVADFIKERDKLFAKQHQGGLLSGLRIPVGDSSVGGGAGIFAGREAAAFAAMGNALQKQQADLEMIQQIEQDILGIREQQADLLQKGSVEEANARARFRQEAFDNQIGNQRQNDEELRRLLRELRDRLRGVGQLIPVGR